MVDSYHVSVRQASECALLPRSCYYYRPSKRDDSVERARIREIAEARVRYGMWRIHTLTIREGWVINHKKTHRIHCEEGLNLRRRKPRRRLVAAHRQERPTVTAPDQVWSMDFVADGLYNERRLRALTIVDNFSRQAMAIAVDHRINGEAVVNVMGRLAAGDRVLRRIQVDNGSEFVSKPLDKWAYEHQVELDLSRPGKPTDNPFIESFNGSFRDECLNLHWLLDLEDARKKIAAWQKEYNEFRPHSSFAGQPPQVVYEKY